VLKILLGSQLRRLRESRNISRDDAGYAIRASGSKISRLERGRVGFKDRDVADLLSLYGVYDERERMALMSLAHQANEPGWWHKYSNVLPNWFEVYIGLEEAASRIRSYEVQFVPGLLQTEGYARAVTLLGHPDAPSEEIERRVALRMARQKILTRDDEAPDLWAVIDEAIIQRPLGGTETMREQLEHLLEVTELPNVILHVMPFRKGGHAAAGGPFSILRFAEPELPDVVYLEQLTSALYLDKREEVDPYLAVMERLCMEAEPASATPDILNRALRDL
jgi:transcriptional regulator with XRE-family HTH domain